jgi:excinuclease UvrABC nuclease subunit
MSLGNEKETISLASSEAERRALQYVQAKLDEKAASSTIAAHQRWFQRRMGTAEIAKISDTLTATWTTCARAKGAEKAYRQFKIKETREENDG